MHSHVVSALVQLGVWALIAIATPVFAQDIDFSGGWVPIFHEDGPERLPGPELMDYLGLPINDQARQWGMHNDGVVQGLSKVPFMQDVKRWGVLTIGTGLGNARFTNRNGKGER